MSTFSQQAQPSSELSENLSSKSKLRQRALWIAVLDVLLEGFFLSVAIYQLILVDFVPNSPFAYLLTVAILVALSMAITGTIFILRRRVNLGLDLVYYANFLPAIAVTLFFTGRAIAAVSSIGIISLLILYIVYPPDNRQAPLIVLVGVIVFAAALEFANPAYRAELPVNTRFGPVASIIFVLTFFGIFFNQAWKQFNVRTKLLSSISFVSLVLIGVLTVNGTRNLLQQAEAQELQHLTSTYENYNNYVGTLENTAASLAISIADRQDVLDLYQARDRQGLLDLLTPVFNTLKENYNIVHLYIESTDGTVFVRVHNPASHGDDITYRLTAAAALVSRQPVAGVEIGPGRLGVRGVAPLYSGDQFVGMTEVGIDYDQTFIDTLKENTGVDYTMWITHQAAAPAGLQPPENFPDAPVEEIFFYASTRQTIPTVPSEAYTRVLESGTPETHYVSDGEQELVVLVAPLLGYGNRIVGIFEIISPRTETLASIRQDLINSLGVAGVVSIVGFISLLLASQFIVLRPIEKLTTISRQQLAGDLSVRIPKLSNDEFDELGETLNALTENLHESVHGLEDRVAERTSELEQVSLQIERRADQFEAIAQVSRTISSIQNLEDLLPRITRMISQHFGFYHAGIFLLDNDREYAVLRAANSEGGRRMLERRHRLEVGQTGIVGYVTATGTPRVALDTGADAVYFDNPDLPNTRSEMALPLSDGNQVIGALDVQSIEPNAFTQEDVNILSALADQVGIAIRNARLYEESREALAQAETVYRQQTGEAWGDIKRLTPIVGYRYNGTKPEPLMQPTSNQQNKGGKGALSIPVKLRGETIGMLRVNSQSESYQWTEDEIVIIRATAERVALAAENARLVLESQKRASKEQTISEISSKISAAINLDNILQTTLREMGRILPGAEISIQVENE